jgi:cathepsin L
VAAAILGMNLCENDTPISAIEQTFMTHMAEQGLSYATPEEYAFRFDIFQKKDAELKEINANPEHTFTVAHNFFSTMTQEEIKKWEGGMPEEIETDEVAPIKPESEILGTQDWRSHMNPIKNQHSCGSCWAFATIQAVEGRHHIRTSQKILLSEQQLVDCVYSRSGCDGGNPNKAYDYIQRHSGSAASSSYPYTGKYGRCQSKTGRVKVTSHGQCKAQSVSGIKSCINDGPISICHGTGTPFHNYRGGILNSKSCPTSSDHCTGLVGYGSNYWILRNSWGTSWGERGYGKIAIVGDGYGICGVQRYPSFAHTS